MEVAVEVEGGGKDEKKLEPGFDENGNFTFKKFCEDIGVDPSLFVTPEVDRVLMMQVSKDIFEKFYSGGKISMGVDIDAKLPALLAGFREVAIGEMMAAGVQFSPKFAFSDHGDMSPDYRDFSFSVDYANRKKDGLQDTYEVTVWKKHVKNPVTTFNITVREDFHMVASKNVPSFNYGGTLRKRLDTKWSPEANDKYVKAYQEYEKYKSRTKQLGRQLTYKKDYLD